MNTRTFAALTLACIGLAGCALPRVEVPPAAATLGTVDESQQVPIRAFTIQSYDRPNEITSDMRFLSGDSRGVLFPKQAREYLSQDLRDYVTSRFRIDPNATTVLTLDLEQAQSYFTMHSNGANWIPFVGVVTSIADGFQQIPVVFAVEVKVDVAGSPSQVPPIDVFIRKTQQITGWSGTINKERDIYRAQISEVRKELFERLDAQVLTLWKDGRFVGIGNAPQTSGAATLASEIARIDTALADEKISRDEHDRLVKSVEAKYLSAPPTKSATNTKM